MKDKTAGPLRPHLPHRLVLGGPHNRLPFEPTAPMVGASLDGRFLAAAREKTRRKVLAFSVDPDGQISNVSEMPLDDVNDMARCGNRVLLLGEKGEQWRCLTLDEKCEVVDDEPLPVSDEPALSPKTVPDSTPPSQVWIDQQDSMVIAQGTNATVVPLKEWTIDLACQSTPKGLVFFRFAGAPGRPEMLFWKEGRLQHVKVGEKEEQGYSPLLFRDKEHLIALWVSRPRQAIRMQVYSEPLATPRDVRELIKARPLQTFYWVRGFQAEDGTLALAWQTGLGGENFPLESDPMTRHEYHFALLDPQEGALSEPILLDEPAMPFLAGGWAQSSLIVFLEGAGSAFVFHT